MECNDCAFLVDISWFLGLLARAVFLNIIPILSFY